MVCHQLDGRALCPTCREMPVPQAQMALGEIPKANRRYALIALDRAYECADFSGCYLILLTLTAQ
jgi:hypothetical protein